MAVTGASTTTNSTSGTQYKSTTKQLQTGDFIKMMLTQLQNQDPLNPAKNEDLMAQMAQIGQMENNTQMSDLLKGLTLQNQIGSAGNLLGKSVQGLDDQNNAIEGVVTSIRVQDNQVSLELDSGKTLSLGNVTYIAPAPTGTGTSVAA